MTEIGKRLREGKGKTVVISDLQTGSLAEVMAALAQAFDSPVPMYYEPFNYEAVRAANESLLARAAVPDYRMDLCDFLISFGADFLETWISPVQFARRFAEMRSPRNGKVGRFVYVGPRLSMTAANADEFIQVPPGGELAVALGMLRVMVEMGWAKGDAGPVKSLLAAKPALPAGVSEEQVAAFAKAFAQAEGGLGWPARRALQAPRCAMQPWPRRSSTMPQAASGRRSIFSTRTPSRRRPGSRN